MAATTYLTAAALEEIVGRRGLLAVASDPDDPEAIDLDRVGRAIEEVSARVDARLRAHYGLPLPDVPGFLSRAVARIVHYELCDEETLTDLIQGRHEASEKLVRDLADGKLRIGGDLDGSATTKPNARTRQGRAGIVRRPTRRFSRDDTAGVV